MPEAQARGSPEYRPKLEVYLSCASRSTFSPRLHLHPALFRRVPSRLLDTVRIRHPHHSTPLHIVSRPPACLSRLLSPSPPSYTVWHQTFSPERQSRKRGASTAAQSPLERSPFHLSHDSTGEMPTFAHLSRSVHVSITSAGARKCVWQGSWCLCG